MKLSEKQFQQQIIDLAQTYHLHVFHHPDSRQVTERGLPDLMIVGSHGMIFAELKTETGKLSDDQLIVGALLRQISDICNAVSYYVWRPSSWDEAKAAMEAIR